MSGALRSAAGDVALKALEPPKVQQLWVEATAAAQSKLIALIEDKGEFVSTAGGVVTLDLKSLLESVTAELGLPGTLVAKLPDVGDLDRDHEVERALRRSEGAQGPEGRRLRPDRADAAPLCGCDLPRRDRRRETLRAVGFSFIVIGAVVLFARSAGGDAVVSSLSGAASSDDAVSSAFTIGTSLVRETGQSIVAYGIVIVLAAWLAGPTRWATSSRRTIAPYLREPRFAYGGLALLLVLLFWWDPVIATHRVVPSLLLIALAVLGTELLRRQVIREFPDRVIPAHRPVLHLGNRGATRGLDPGDPRRPIRPVALEPGGCPLRRDRRSRRGRVGSPVGATVAAEDRRRDDRRQDRRGRGAMSAEWPGTSARRALGGEVRSGGGSWRGGPGQRP